MGDIILQAFLLILLGLTLWFLITHIRQNIKQYDKYGNIISVGGLTVYSFSEAEKLIDEEDYYIYRRYAGFGSTDRILCNSFGEQVGIIM